MTAVTGFSPDTPPEVRRRVVIVLGLAVLGISSSAVLIRFMEDIGPITLAAWRCLGSALILSPGIGLSYAKLDRRDLGMTTAAGFLLGLHFAVWFASLSYTTVMRSTVLVALVPVWTGLLEWGVLGRRPTRAFWLGTTVALMGVGLMTGGDFSGGALIGDLLATVGGVLWALYFILGRQVRQRVEITAYMGLVCAAAALLLFPLALVWGEALVGFTEATWGLVLLAIIGPQLIGHQGTNYAVKYLPATVVSTTMLLEPVGATLLAMLLLGEMPGAVACVGGLVVMAGVGLATR